MAIANAQATWTGGLKDGNGNMKLGSGAFDGPFSFKTRFEGAAATNPEELIGAAHAGCFSMAFSAGLGKAGYSPKSIHTTAKVHLEQVAGGFSITLIELETEADIPDISEEDFRRLANEAKSGCPVSKVLAGAQIELKATLK